jgi:hypothetical protein
MARGGINMLEPDYYFHGLACYLSCDVGSNDDCGYRDEVGYKLDEPFDIYSEVVGIYEEWRSK